jgi:hypothetical protein
VLFHLVVNGVDTAVTLVAYPNVVTTAHRK